MVMIGPFGGAPLGGFLAPSSSAATPAKRDDATTPKPGLPAINGGKADDVPSYPYTGF